MSAAQVADGRTARVSHVTVSAAYASLALLLLWSRLYGLGRGGYCCDESLTVDTYVRGGPSEILAGAYLPNNHQLYSLLGWAASALVGESEVVLRLGAAIPFIAGVVVVTAWLHRRIGAFPGIVFLGLATASPLLLDLSRQARGYGLVFLAMCIVVVAALESARTESRWPVAALCLGGIAGTWTLPHFAIAFATVALVLVALDVRRRETIVALASATAASLAWYAPHLSAVLDSSRQEYAVEISSRWILTAPVDQTLVPAFSLLSDDYLHPNLASLALVALFAIVMTASPLLRDRLSALLVVTPVLTTIAVFWITNTHAAPRFFSFLLVPLLMLVATGATATLQRVTIRRPPIRAVAAVSLLLVLVVASLPFLSTIPRQPREAMREVSRAIADIGPSTPVFAYVFHPGDLEFHLGRLVTQTRSEATMRRACALDEPVIVVTQIWMLEPLTPPCVDRAGTRHLRFEQYARGGAMDMWVIPPRGGST